MRSSPTSGWDHRGHWNWVYGKNLFPSALGSRVWLMGQEPLRAALDRMRSRGCLRRLALASRAAGPGLGFPWPLCPPFLLNHQFTIRAWPLGKDAAGPGLELCSLIIHSFNLHVFSTYCVPGTGNECNSPPPGEETDRS